MIAALVKFFLRIPGFFLFSQKARHQRITSTRNNPKCTHLSNHILSSQVILGNFVPGKLSRNVTSNNQKMAVAK